MNLLTPNGWKDINDVNVGDDLVAYDVNTGQEIVNQLISKQLLTVQEEEATFYRINGTWTLYKNQSVWVDGRVDHAFNLKSGDTVYNGTDEDVAVTTVEEVTGTGWWRLEVSGDHSYIADDLTLHNASRYWVGGGSSTNWNATANTNWGSSSGVQDNSSVPTSADDVVFDGAGVAGNSNSTISATITVLSLNITSGYSATMTHNAVLTIAGNWTMSNSHTIAGSSGIILSGGTTTITSGGQTWPNDLTFSYSITYNTITLVGNFICGGTTIITGGYGKTINKTTSETYTTKGITLTSGYIDGTSEKILSGGTWQGTGGTIGGLLTFDSGVNTTTISGVVTFNGTILKYTSGTVTTTASTLTLSAGTQTLNTSGITWNNVVCSFPSFASTITLTSNFVCTGSTTFSGGYSTAINKTVSETWTSNGLVISGKGLSGTSEFILSGGTWSSTGSYISINLTFAGNVTVSGTVYYTDGILKYTSGTITTTGSTLHTRPCVLNTNGITWNNFEHGGLTITLTSNFTCTGTTKTIGETGNCIVNKTTSETWSTNGLDCQRFIYGSAEIILTGGTWIATNSGTSVENNLTLNGSVTISGNVYYGQAFGAGTLKYTSGTITVTGSTLNIGHFSTLDTNGITWNNVTFPNTSYTQTINSLLSVSGTLTIGTSGVNFTGTSGWTCSTLSNSSTSAATITLKDGNTYTVTGAMNVFQSRSGSPVLFTSSHASNRAILTLRNPSSCNCLASFTRIDASQGRTVTAFMGTVTDCLNVISYNDMRPVAA